MNPADTENKVRLEFVVGYDGTEPAQRALVAAKQMMSGRDGHLEVVFVAHLPALAATNAMALVEAEKGLDQQELELFSGAGEILRDGAIDWGFLRRDGNVAEELLVAAEERQERVADATVVLVVGGSSHKIDRYLNCTAARVIRRDRFTTLVVP